MGGSLSLEWKERVIAETRSLCLGLFVTAVLARVIANLGFDNRPTPVLSTSLDSEVLHFLFFVVRPQIRFQIQISLTRLMQFSLRVAHILSAPLRSRAWDCLGNVEIGSQTLS